MAWSVIFHEEFDAELQALQEALQDELLRGAPGDFYGATTGGIWVAAGVDTCVLVHIQVDEKLENFIHGRSPRWLLTTRSPHVARRSRPRNLRRRRWPSRFYNATILSNPQCGAV